MIERKNVNSLKHGECDVESIAKNGWRIHQGGIIFWLCGNQIFVIALLKDMIMTKNHMIITAYLTTNYPYKQEFILIYRLHPRLQTRPILSSSTWGCYVYYCIAQFHNNNQSQYKLSILKCNIFATTGRIFPKF